MKRFAKKLLNTCVAPLGLEVVRHQRDDAGSESTFTMPSTLSRLRHAHSIGFHPTQIVDAGAFSGGWTTEVESVFPGASYLVIEPNPYLHATIRESTSPFGSRATLIPKAIGERPGTLKLNIWGDPKKATSASLQSHVRGKAENEVDVEVTTIDQLLEEHCFTPQLIKLDLQGAEMKALRGCAKALDATEMFIVEFGCLNAYIDRATPNEILEIFYDNNYSLYDIVDCHYRPYDGALTGGDFFFVKNSSSLKSYLDYK